MTGTDARTLTLTLRKSQVPLHLHSALVNYVINHKRPGEFLTAVLENNLVDAMRRADDESRESLYHIVGFLVWEVPGACWGSPERVHRWLSQKGEA
jgi:hypothetical protein